MPRLRINEYNELVEVPEIEDLDEVNRATFEHSYEGEIEFNYS